MDLVQDPQQDNSHYPPDNSDDSWQESWACAWYDPRADVSGWHHFSIRRNAGVVDVKTWISVRSKLVHSFQTWTIPAPDQDYTDITVGPVRVRSLTPLTRHAIEIDDGDVEATIEFTPLVGPHWYSRPSMDLHADGRKDHWESYAQFAGQVRVGGEAIAVSGLGFWSRSWGPRDLSRLLTHRIVFACFGEDLTVRLFHPTTPAGPAPYGFAVDRNRLLPIRDMTIQTIMSSDGVNPTGCEVTAWTEGGGGYVFSGTCAPGHTWVNTHPGAMYSHASTVFRLGGRLGTGFFQVNELKQPAPWDLARLGLAED